MPATRTVRERVCEETVKWIWARPLTFDQFLEEFGPKDYVELVDGAAVEKNMVQLEHEKLQLWLMVILHQYVKMRGLGIMLGSRTAVEISRYRGRLPDLLFVRQERMEIVREKAVYGAPDLVIEIISPGDRPSDIIALETDYCTIGVLEVVFIDQRKRRVRILRRQEDGYSEEVISSGGVMLETLNGIRFETDWLFTEPRPDERATVDAFLSGASC